MRALSAIHVYPVKSCAGHAPPSARVEPRGLAGDRRFVVVDHDGTFVTGREEPRMTRIAPELTAAGIRLHADGREPFDVIAPHGNAERMAVSVWDDRIDAAVCDPAADAWITAFLGRPVRLAYMDDYAPRAVSLDYGRAGDVVSFADGYPLLLLSQAALDALNAKLAAPIPMTRFRPNLVVAGTAPHAEDDWRRIRIGGVEFDVVKPCVRCVFTTVDGERGAFDPSREPLITLKTYRRSPQGITFGQNLIPRGKGEIRVGDAVTVLESKPAAMQGS
jgi:uncharacterized protein YcbX